MEIGSFCQLLKSADGRFRSRALIVPDVSDFNVLKGHYGSEFEVLRFSEFVTSDCFVPMPDRVFSLFDDRRMALRKPIIGIGLDGYLSILDDAQIACAMSYVRGYLDGCGVESVVFVFRQRWGAMSQAFQHPSLFADNIFAEIGCGGAYPLFAKTKVTLISGKFAKRVNSNYDSVREYLKKMETWAVPNEDEIRIAVQFNGEQAFGGLSRNVTQYPSLKGLFKAYCDFHADFSDVAFRWVAEKTQGMDVAKELRDYFYPNGSTDILLNVLLRYRSIANSGEREVFLFVLETLVPKSSYVARVIATAKGRAEEFLERYVNVPEELLGADNALTLAEERNAAIRQIKVDCMEVRTAVAALIGKSKAIPVRTMKHWLQLGLDIEETEWMRLAFVGEASERLEAAEQSELLCAYRNAQFDDLNPQLTGYFSAYRELKCADSVTSEFCETAFKCAIPEDVPTRESLLVALREDSDTALLVVDAMGAEYIPFLLDRAKRYNIKPVAVHYSTAKLPASTPFNPVKDEWGDKRYWKFNDFDAAIHDSTYSDTAAAMSKELRILDRDVMGRVAVMLGQYKRVVLTADHGASRLAVLARKAGLSRDITDFNGKLDVLDWRFAKRHSATHLDSDDFVEPLNMDFVIIKGYNRFSKSGGPGFEIHGGATIEEQVVPVIVFERVAAFSESAPTADPVAQKPQSVVNADAQIGINNDFDI